MVSKPLYKQIMEYIGLNNKVNKIPGSKDPIIGYDIEDNALIFYPSIEGGPITYTVDEEKPGVDYHYGTPNTTEAFHRIRLKNPDKDNFKYKQPGGTGIQVFVPPAMVKQYQQGNKIKNLFIVEGEKKALAGSLNGLNIIGIGGIQMWRAAKKKPDLHPYIEAIIKACSVENVVLLFDADATEVTWDVDNEPQKDLAKRPFNFYNSVKEFRDACRGLDNTEIYFGQIKKEFNPESKGLDDLYFNYPNEINEINDRLERLSSQNKYFIIKNVMEEGIGKLKDHFHLKTKGKQNIPEDFYKAYQHIIGNNVFIFNKKVFRPSDNGELELKQHPEAAKYVRIGCDYFKYVHRKDVFQEEILNGQTKEELLLKPWKKGEIKQDYVEGGEKINYFFDMIDKYDESVNVPYHNQPYKRVINNCLNLYHPIKWEPKAGDFPNIWKLLNHIFNNQFQEKLELALDYIQLIWQKPLQKLPILCLVSEENATGKSTFLKLMKEIYGQNATFISNEQFQNKFNAHYITKKLIMIDEGFIPIDKPYVKEKLKSMVTSSKQHLESKGKDVMEVDFFGTFFMTSNNEDNFVNVDKEETRWFICKVPPLTEQDPDLLHNMVKEIPAFLDYLNKRNMVYSKKERFWFSFEDIKTDALQHVVKESKWVVEKEIDNVLKDKFFETGVPVIYLSIKVLSQMLREYSRYPVGNAYLKKALQKMEIDKTKGSRRFRVPVAKFEETISHANPVTIDFQHKSHDGMVYQSNCYKFFITDFMDQEERKHLTFNKDLLQFMTYLDPEDLEYINRLEENNEMEFQEAKPTNQPDFMHDN